MRDGFGGEVLKRSYWRKKSMVLDGLVQRRIEQFSTIVPKLEEGVGDISASSRPKKAAKLNCILPLKITE